MTGIEVGFALVVVVVGLAWWRRRWREHIARTDDLKALAKRFDYGFTEIQDSLVQRSFALFSRGRDKRATYVLTGNVGPAEIKIFRYEWSSSLWRMRLFGSSGSSHSSLSSSKSGFEVARSYERTVIRFTSPSLTLPAFTLDPENTLHKIGQALGYQDLDFESHERFSKTYLLRGEDEAAVRALFSPFVLDCFEHNPDLHVEGRGDTLFVHVPGFSTSDQLVELIDKAEDIYLALADFEPEASDA